MKFCPKDGSLLMPKKEGSKSVLACSTCSYKESMDGSEIKVKVEKTKDDVAVIDNEDENLPTTEEKCEKCGHDKAWYWLVQTRAGDEPETKFLKCMKCKHTWRDYS